MFVYNDVSRDSRVLREARSLAEAGHRVTVIGRPRSADEREITRSERDGFEIVLVPMPHEWRRWWYRFRKPWHMRGLIRRMGQHKAIIFSTHILEEVEAVCSRAIIIDRGKIVASGTPQQLKSRSDQGGAVLLAVRGPTGAQLAEKLSRMSNARKATIVKEENGEVWARVYPTSDQRNGELVRNVIEAANGWKVEEIRTEEGHLDEVFRSITLPETAETKVEDK